jgi:hypothetical protein
MTIDLSLLFHTLALSFVSILAVSMIGLAAGQRLVAVRSTRKLALARRQRVLAEARTKTWGGNTPTFRR